MLSHHAGTLVLASVSSVCNHCACAEGGVASAAGDQDDQWEWAAPVKVCWCNGWHWFVLQNCYACVDLLICVSCSETSRRTFSSAERRRGCRGQSCRCARAHAAETGSALRTTRIPNPCRHLKLSLHSFCRQCSLLISKWARATCAGRERQAVRRPASWDDRVLWVRLQHIRRDVSLQRRCVDVTVKHSCIMCTQLGEYYSFLPQTNCIHVRPCFVVIQVEK